MRNIEKCTFDEERALYGARDILVRECVFDGPADGESAFKEGGNITAVGCRFNLRYPFWHNDTVSIDQCEMTESCRAALWYSTDISVKDTKMHGIKALRECSRINIEGCDIISTEFGWFNNGVRMRDVNAVGEYFMMRSSALDFKNVTLNGKYSFQYIEDAVFDGCTFNTKDAFWHAKNITVRNSTVSGEYLAWYCENVTFENCIITGTQPLCYCKGLRLIGCEMHGCDLAFEKSEVNADITTPIISIKNAKSGRISAPSVSELIMDGADAKCEIVIG